MTISLCMIVKNEEINLKRCLESVKHLVDEMVIVDTGSTDATVRIANSFSRGTGTSATRGTTGCGKREGTTC